MEDKKLPKGKRSRDKVFKEMIAEKNEILENLVKKAEKELKKEEKKAKAIAKEQEEEQKKIYLGALEIIEGYSSRKKIDLKYFINCAKICMTSEKLGLHNVGLNFGRYIADWYYEGKFEKEVRKKECEEIYLKLVRGCLDATARMGDFDSFCLAMELCRRKEARFYYPRREVLRKLNIVQDLQDLADGKLDVLAISMPQRTGKSRIGLFFLTFMMFRYIERDKQIFGVGHGASLVSSFYDEILSYLTDKETYRVNEIFPNHTIADKSSDDKSISLDRIKGMPNIAFRSIDGAITGAVEGGLLMYADDLIKDQSEVINTELADKIWSKFNTLVLGRMKKGVPLLYMGTMWGQNCPISRLREEYSDKNLEKLGLRMRCRFNAISCYDENGESQFNYRYDVGFDTNYYKRIQHTLEKADRALWQAMYLAKPISRLGRPFENIQFYNKLPDRECDFIASVIDVATQKDGDNWSCPIGLFYEEEKEIYIDEVVYSNKGVDYTIPKTIDMFLRRKPIQCEIEEKESTQGIIRTGIGAKINDLLIARGFRTRVHSHSASGLKSKRERILKYSTDILGIETDFSWKVYFNETRYNRDLEYKNFCNDIINWSEDDKAQKTQKDDGIDSLAQLLEYCCPHNNGGIINNGLNLKDLGL